MRSDVYVNIVKKEVHKGKIPINPIKSLFETQHTVWLDLIDLFLMRLIVPVYRYFSISFLE